MLASDYAEYLGKLDRQYCCVVAAPPFAISFDDIAAVTFDRWLDRRYAKRLNKRPSMKGNKC